MRTSHHVVTDRVIDKALRSPLYRSIAALVLIAQIVGVMLLIKRLGG